MDCCIRKEIIGNATLYLADNRAVLPELSGIHACVTDPPYELGFMGKAWDSTGIAYQPDLWRLVLNALPQGAHLLSLSAPRTYHRMACAIEDAGFELRDCIMFLFGTGFPKSKNLHGDWKGWGSSLKPAYEPICMARKPFTGTLYASMEANGTGALNIDGCRVPIDPEADASQLRTMTRSQRKAGDGWGMSTVSGDTPQVVRPEGRWPANLIHDGSDEVRAAFPFAKGQQGAITGEEPSSKTNNVYGQFGGRPASTPRAETDVSAARFFYCAKASKADRDEGLDDLPERQYSHDGRQTPIENAYQRNASAARNHHPTVKPTNLMRYLCRLVTPPGGIILDPFMGSGSTGKAAVLEGFSFIGIEQDPEYFEIACRRIEAAYKAAGQPVATPRTSSDRQETPEAANDQLSLFGAA